jgi:ribulose-bisphosphate carboxylase large chain
MTVPQQQSVRGLSGERFSVHYRIRGSEAEASNLARIVANEQTVEFPDEFLPAGDITDHVIGRVEELSASGAEWHARISYELGSAGSDLPQLINLLNGLTSLLPDLQATRVDLSPSLAERFNGPRFGIKGLRELIGVYDRPLLCTALKPMGLSTESLARIAYECALGGLDMMKDDHGITDLPFSPFAERVPRIAEAVAEANARTGGRSVYVANITSAADRILERALFAQEAGAAMLMVAPAIVGFDTMRMIADDPRVHVPIMSHPTVSGGYVGGETAPFSFYLYHGQLHRLAGCDVSIYANYGSRFPITKEDSHAAAAGCRDEFSGLKRGLPLIGGGMSIDRGPGLREEFGVDAAFLVGGRLHSLEETLSDRVKQLIEAVR